MCESWPPYAEQLQNEAISPLNDVAAASIAHKEAICSQSNRLLKGAVSSAAAADVNRQSGANKGSLNKRSLRTLKCNEAQGAAITVYVYYRPKTIQNLKRSIKHEDHGESCWRLNTVSSQMVLRFAHITITCNHAANCAQGKTVDFITAVISSNRHGNARNDIRHTIKRFFVLPDFRLFNISFYAIFH